MIQKQVHESQLDFELLRQLVTTTGFFQAYFRLLKVARTNEEAFNHVNDQYFEYTGEYRYSDLKSFKSVMAYLRKNNKMA